MEKVLKAGKPYWWKVNFFFFKFLFPDAADKLTDGFENRASTSAGNNPPPENEDYVSFAEWHKRESNFECVFIQTLLSLPYIL